LGVLEFYLPFLECELREFFFTQEDTVVEFVSLQVTELPVLVRKDIGVCRRLKLLLVWGFHIGAVVAGARGRQLESLNGEGEVLVIGVVDEEPVVDALLEALGLVAGGHQGASLASRGALLDPGGLGECLVVGLHSVHDHSPLAVGVDRPEGHDVGSDRGAEVSLLHDLLQSVHAVLGVGQHILVDCLDALVVVLQGMLNLVGGVLGILQTPGLGVVNGTDWGLVSIMVWGRGRVVGSCVSHNWSSMGDWVSHCVVDGSDMVLHDGLVMGGTMVGDTVGGVVHGGDVGSVVSHWGNNCVVCHWGNTVCRGRSLVMDEGGDSCLVHWSLMVGGLWTIYRGRDGGVAVGSSMVDLSISVSLSFRFCVGAGGHKGQNNQV